MLNAITFTRKFDARVKMHVKYVKRTPEENYDEVVIALQDNGYGIPQKRIRKALGQGAVNSLKKMRWRGAGMGEGLHISN